ncbi:hypothetical protein Ancab_013668 [Ancistrocladus abbreviatus]
MYTTAKGARLSDNKMKNGKIILCLVAWALVVIILITIRQPDCHFHSIKYDVRIVNGFTNNSSLPLVIWCASKDSDMGGRALQEGDDYSWSLETKLFTWIIGDDENIFCTMKWDGRRKKFDAFRVSRDSHRCSPLRLCLWLVKEDGFYFSNDGKNYFKDFSWT